MTHLDTFTRQITKKIIFPSLIFFIFIGFSACTGGSNAEDSVRDWCMRKTDTLWTELAETRKNFVYGMDDIAFRKMEMDSQLQVLKIAADNLGEVDRSTILQYHSVFTVYKPMAEKYKAVVMETEDVFFRIKALEKTARNGGYDSKIEEFKKTWNEIHAILVDTRERALGISEKLKAVEPQYLRLSPKIDDLMMQVSQK